MVLKSPPTAAPAEKIVVVDQVMESSSEAESESELDLSYDNAIEDLKSQVRNDLIFTRIAGIIIIILRFSPFLFFGY